MSSFVSAAGADVYDVTNPPTGYTAAIPDDNGDDFDAIDALIDMVQSKGGGTLYFPPGRYHIYDRNNEFYFRISDTPNLTLLGSDSQPLQSIISFVHRTTGDPNTYYDDKGFFIERSPYFTMRNLHLTSESAVVNGKLSQNMANGLMIRQGSPHAMIDNVDFSFFSRHGLLVRSDAVEKSDYLRVNNCRFNDIRAIDASPDHESRAAFISCQVTLGDRDNYLKGVSFTNSYITTAGFANVNNNQAFYAGFVQDLTFANNTIEGPAMQSGDNYHENRFSIFPDARGVEIWGNTFKSVGFSLHSAVEAHHNNFFNCRNFRAVGFGSKFHSNTFTIDGNVGIPYIVHLDDFTPTPEQGNPIHFFNNHFQGSNMLGIENAFRNTDGYGWLIENNTFDGIPYPILIREGGDGQHVIQNNRFYFQQGAGGGITFQIPTAINAAWNVCYLTNNHFTGFTWAFDDTLSRTFNIYDGNTHNGQPVSGE
ncbi:hypothetical protein [Acanthopleuribacter pedis]|uniref:Pectate lyase superfamily protein domain-containing protein n=1 Tax=Acanthopleuribacter pedis TaxID=442870 RepID=A0A8J7QIL1_9BACT|nr:hypothetical protein [Acanthopleuribacter pedis]MBO1321416.1 hypothetical protein [Acanthopleuribacter pedis]